MPGWFGWEHSHVYGDIEDWVRPRREALDQLFWHQVGRLRGEERRFGG